ncbi:MAG: hypothetical protein K2N73_04890 [Lachnospiraceae bacterium]|nr:hypothetical protein [Lachnospiraceae bacterium]
MGGQQANSENHTGGETEKSMEQMMKRLRRELIFTRIMCMITSVLTILLLAGGVYLFGQVQTIAKQVQPVMEQVAAVDVENVNETLRQVRNSLEKVDLQEAADTLKQAVNTLNGVDIEALNSAIEGLDTEELSKTLANLNDAVDSLHKMEDSLNLLFGKKR